MQVKSVQGLYVFKFSDDQQERLETLNEKQRAANLTLEEAVKRVGIFELD
ncbi:hypothetical protein ACFVKH_05785 [Almyronema epifaneia S1]|uniref:Uncharacterized protein n=1 Tax=Almyronema epifaneia S1 TaxID=2991925 RepID=A0ABW6IC95_9CYAN